MAFGSFDAGVYPHDFTKTHNNRTGQVAKEITFDRPMVDDLSRWLDEPLSNALSNRYRKLEVSLLSQATTVADGTTMLLLCDLRSLRQRHNQYNAIGKKCGRTRTTFNSLLVNCFRHDGVLKGQLA